MTALQLTTCLLLAYIIPTVLLLFMGRHWRSMVWTADLNQPSLLMVMIPAINIITVIVVLIFMCVVCVINFTSKHKTRLHKWYYRDYH